MPSGSSSSGAAPPAEADGRLNWSKLPADLIESVSRKIALVSDYARFRAVCKPWRAAAPPRPRHLRQQLPWLLLPYDTDGSSARRFYSPGDDDVHVLRLPGFRGKRCCGSSRGWLLMLGDTPAVCLLNPVTGASIPLPPLTSFCDVVAFRPDEAGREYLVRGPEQTLMRMVSATDMRKLFLRKMVLSSDPTVDADSIVMVVLFDSGKLAFCKVLGGDEWSSIDVPGSFGVVLDVTYYEGKFYASCQCGRVAVCDMGGGGGVQPSLSLVSPVVVNNSNAYYLMPSPYGGLLLIARYIKGLYGQDPNGISHTTKCRVFKLDVSGGWVVTEINSVGGNVVFLGANHSICLPARDYSGLKGDRIYYVDTNWYPASYNRHGYGSFGQYDVCVLNVRDGSVELMLQDIRKLKKEWTLTAWMTPNIC